MRRKLLIKLVLMSCCIFTPFLIYMISRETTEDQYKIWQDRKSLIHTSHDLEKYLMEEKIEYSMIDNIYYFLIPNYQITLFGSTVMMIKVVIVEGVVADIIESPESSGL